MRVCLISREYPPDTGWGGIATFTYHLAHGLKEIGHHVEVVTLSNDTAKLVDDDGIQIHRVPPHKYPGPVVLMNLCMPTTRHMLSSSAALWQKFHELHKAQTFDVVDTPELLVDGLFPAITRITPLVIRLYTPYSKFIAEKLHNITPSFDYQFLAMLERVAMLSADVLTSPSKDLADFVAADLNYPHEKIKIIHNPINTDKFSPNGHKAFESDGRPSVLFVGRLEERKGIHYLIEAIPKIIKECGPVRFVIIGSDTETATGHRSVLSTLKKSLTHSGCLKYVTFIPRVALEDLPSYYRSADICVIPSVYDNSPYTCLEAMSCGRPVIGTTGGGMPEYMGNEDAGILVPPRDTPAIAQAIIKLAKDEALRHRVGNNARRRVLVHFKRSEIARKMTELYIQAINNFTDNPGTSLYLKDPSQCLFDTEIFVYSFARNIAEFLRLHSFRDRCRYWWSLKRRPRLLIAKSFTSLFEMLLRLLGYRPVWLAELKEKLDMHEYC